MALLSKYLADASQMLNDSNYASHRRRLSATWVNEARTDAAKITGCIRRLITGQSAFGASAQAGQAVPGAMQPGALPSAFPAGL